MFIATARDLTPSRARRVQVTGPTEGHARFNLVMGLVSEFGLRTADAGDVAKQAEQVETDFPEFGLTVRVWEARSAV